MDPEENEPILTDAQEDARKRVMQILEEHFDCGVLILGVVKESDRNTAEANDSSELSFFGGHFTALGLIETAKVRLLTGNDD